VKNRKLIYTIITLLFALGFYIYDNYSGELKTINSKDEEIEINTNFLPTSTTNQIVHHKYYSLSYNEKYEQAEWVAYALTKNHLSNKNIKRPYFELDPKVKTKSSHYKNFKNSGYNKGHLCPAGDRTFSEEAFNETFLTSNI